MQKWKTDQLEGLLETIYMDNDRCSVGLKYSLSPWYTYIVRNPIISRCIKFFLANSYADILSVGIDKPAIDIFKDKSVLKMISGNPSCFVKG